MKQTFKRVLILCFVLISHTLIFVACDSSNEISNETQSPSKTSATTTAPHEHDFGDWETVMLPTCKQEGGEERKCNGCEETETRTISKLEQHSTMHGICASCGDFVGLLSEEWDIIRVTNNDIAHLNQQISLKIWLGGDLDIDRCNSLFEKTQVISNELAKHPTEFTDFSKHFSLLMDKWHIMTNKVNTVLTKSERISAWKEFSSYYIEWQKEYFTITNQYFPPNQ